MKPRLRDPVPAVLYRCFETLEWAEQFLAGSIRMGSLVAYQTTEDTARSDREEGRAHIRYPGLVRQVAWNMDTNEVREVAPRHGLLNEEAEDVTSMKLICFSRLPVESIEQVSSKFGRFVIRVNDPAQTIEAISEALQRRHDLIGPLECGNVRYENSPVLAGAPTPDDYATFQSFAKPVCFTSEQEFRMLQRFTGRPTRHSLTIELGEPLRRAELLPQTEAGPRA